MQVEDLKNYGKSMSEMLRDVRDEEFISSQIEWAATFSALSKLLGSGRAIEILNEVMEATAPQAFAHMMPSADETVR